MLRHYIIIAHARAIDAAMHPAHVAFDADVLFRLIMLSR